VLNNISLVFEQMCGHQSHHSALPTEQFGHFHCSTIWDPYTLVWPYHAAIRCK